MHAVALVWSSRWGVGITTVPDGSGKCVQLYLQCIWLA